MEQKPFKDRVHAGCLLAQEVSKVLGAFPGEGGSGPIVLGLARGGVVVAREVAHALKAPLDVFVVRKVGVPHQRELALGAVASGGVCVFNQEVLDSINLSKEKLKGVIEEEKKKLSEQEKLYRREGSFLDFKGRQIILVDDGLATGATMLAAVEALHHLYAAHLIVSIPVASVAACKKLKSDVDHVVCLVSPEPFYSVSSWYENFEQVGDEEVRALLATSYENR